MEDYSAYELAQERIKQRQRKQNHTLLWLLITVACILLAWLTEGCTLLIAIFAGVITVFGGIEWYFSSTRGAPSFSETRQEVAWLFHENWENGMGIHEYSLALERIRKRRMGQAQFIFHLGCFLVANLIVVTLLILNLSRNPDLQSAQILIGSVLWLLLLIYHWANAFPSQDRLERREREAGEIIQREIEQMQPAKRKNKLKRDVYYVLDDDGELVEANPLEDEKPKHRLQIDDDEIP